MANGSPLNEPRVPKPAKQGDAGRSHQKPPIRGSNGQRVAGAGRVMKGRTQPGTGTRGTGTRNNPPRT
jgi:hypothetical protein